MGLCFVFNALAARLHLQRRHGRAKTVQNPGKGNEVENDRVPSESQKPESQQLGCMKPEQSVASVKLDSLHVP